MTAPTANVCPSCGLPPTATSENDLTGQVVYECENAHTWPAGD